VIAGTVMAATAVAIRELFMRYSAIELSAPHVLTWLIGWQVVWFSAFTYLRLAARRSLPLGTTIEVTVLAVTGAFLPAVAVLMLAPWVWAVLVGQMVVTAAIAVRQILLWRKDSSR
jgi:hypothetical protein